MCNKPLRLGRRYWIVNNDRSEARILRIYGNIGDKFIVWNWRDRIAGRPAIIVDRDNILCRVRLWHFIQRLFGNKIV